MLKYLKSDIKRWNKKVFGDLYVRINLHVKDIKFLDLKGGKVPFSFDYMMCKVFVDVWTFLKIKILRWTEVEIMVVEDKLGNKKLLSFLFKLRVKKIHILALKVEDLCVEEVVENSLEITLYFTHHFVLGPDKTWWYHLTKVFIGREVPFIYNIVLV